MLKSGSSGWDKTIEKILKFFFRFLTLNPIFIRTKISRKKHFPRAGLNLHLFSCRLHHYPLGHPSSFSKNSDFLLIFKLNRYFLVLFDAKIYPKTYMYAPLYEFFFWKFRKFEDLNKVFGWTIFVKLTCFLKWSFLEIFSCRIRPLQMLAN